MTTIAPAPALAPTLAPLSPRGPISYALLALLRDGVDPGVSEDSLFQAQLQQCIARSRDVINDDDLQLALFLLNSLHYGGILDVDAEWEWHPITNAARRALETAFEAHLRSVVPVPPLPNADAESVAAALFAMTSVESGPSLSRYVAGKATTEQLRELLVQRSIYTLREADPHSWAIPRLTGRAKAALVEIQADEYGGGRPELMHAVIFAGTMRGLGLDDTYGRYIDNVPAIVLASVNMMTLFGLNRRLRGAISGHLAAFEMTSSIPNGLYARGFRRNGFGDDVAWYFDEHVEADAVHEQIAGRDLAGGLAESDPDLLPDIMFGAAACLAIDGWAGEQMLDAWQSGESSLRLPLQGRA